ncbi:nascent polypeptide-associated complex subunit alpha, muscle-specific form-like [Ammospiza caudacuta]|uniref:nascent polypeptide-associated complex subunit alpha, muscle-specific form-like n=1 Tax=Ammospiza caudacuta TaxID=2857398 RepID=UPI002739E083|nr:nascent polypeptide-associated complex subunit alpha, muscle-specific form-like [Ammospiza caudacuta]
MQNSASSRADAAPRPSRRQGPGPAAEPPGSPGQQHLPPRCGARSGVPAGPAPVPVAAGRARGAGRGAERRAVRSAGRAARLPRPSPACPPARGAPRRPVTRSGTREGTAKGAKSFKNMSHAHIKFKFTSRPPPAAIGGRGPERGAVGARRARHWLRGAVTHPPGDMTDTKLLRHSLGNVRPTARRGQLPAPRGDSGAPGAGPEAEPAGQRQRRAPRTFSRNRPCAPAGTPRVLLRVGIPESRRKRQHPQDLGCHVPLSFSYSAKYRPTLTGRGGGSQRPRRDPRRSSRHPRRASPRALASNGRVLPAKFSRMGTGLAVTWIRRPVCRTPAPLPPAPLLAPRKAPRCTHSPPLGHGGAAGGGDAAPGYWQRTIREPAPPPRVERKKKKKKYAEEAPGARPGGGREGAAAAGGGVPAARLGSARLGSADSSHHGRLGKTPICATKEEEGGEWRGCKLFPPPRPLRCRPAPRSARRPRRPRRPSRAARRGGSRRLPAPRGFSRTEPAAAAVPGSRSRRRKGRRAGGGGGGVSPRALPQAERLSRPWRRRNTPPLRSAPRSDRPARPPGGLQGTERPWTGWREEAALPPAGPAPSIPPSPPLPGGGSRSPLPPCVPLCPGIRASRGCIRAALAGLRWRKPAPVPHTNGKIGANSDAGFEIIFHLWLRSFRTDYV